MLTQEKLIRRSYMAVLALEINEKNEKTLQEFREIINDYRKGYAELTLEGKKHLYRLIDTSDFLISLETKLSVAPQWYIFKEGLIIFANDLRENDGKNHLIKIADDVINFMEAAENIDL